MRIPGVEIGMPARCRGVRVASCAGAVLVFVLSPLMARAETVSILAARDNTIYEERTTNSNGSGPVMNAGKIATEKIRRAFVLFDIASSTIPAGATIDAATLHLNLTNVPSGPTPTTIRLHRVSRSWGEGASSSSTGSGVRAEAGDVTWLVRFYPDSSWNAPGGDFDGTVHGEGPVNTALGAYDIPSTPTLVQDVQYWLDHPSAANFGWMLRADESAGLSTTVRGIATREDATYYPVLEVAYTPSGAGVEPQGGQALQLSASPNPFRSGTRFAFDLPRASSVRIAIHDIRGRQVARLADGSVFPAGAHTLSWDCRGSGGKPVPAGVYFATLDTPADGSRTVRVLRIP
jgi:hypothetical protein